MRRGITLISILLLGFTGFAQTYQEQLGACTKAFQNGMEAKSEMMRLMQDLRQCVIGQTFPDFSATAMDGKKYTRDDMKGKVVMINMWFIACPPCVAEMPMLEELNKQFRKRDFLLLAFSTDDENSITNFMKKRNASYAIFANSKSLIVNTFKMQFGFPVNMILDKEGKIVEFKMGGPVEEAGVANVEKEFKRIIDKELAR